MKSANTIFATSDLTISFHTSEDDANTNTNPISSTSAYNANTQTVYTRIESDITTCFALVIFEIIVKSKAPDENIIMAVRISI